MTCDCHAANLLREELEKTQGELKRATGDIVMLSRKLARSEAVSSEQTVRIAELEAKRNPLPVPGWYWVSRRGTDVMQIAYAGVRGAWQFCGTDQEIASAACEVIAGPIEPPCEFVKFGPQYKKPSIPEPPDSFPE